MTKKLLIHPKRTEGMPDSLKTARIRSVPDSVQDGSDMKP